MLFNLKYNPYSFIFNNTIFKYLRLVWLDLNLLFGYTESVEFYNTVKIF